MKAAVIGGTGRMGKWFAQFLKEQGFKVIISGRTQERTLETAKEMGLEPAISNIQAVKEADFVVVSVPIEKTGEVIHEVSSQMKKGAILFDIASIKGEILEILKKAQNFGIRTISIHPLFGPGTRNISGKKVLIIPINEDYKTLIEVKDIFEDGGAKVHVVDAKIHDTMMALTLSFPHFLNVLFGKMIKSTNINEVKEWGGTTFALQLVLAESVASEDPSLYSSIQMNNPSFHRLLDNFMDYTKELIEVIKNRDEEAFVEYFKDLKMYFSNDPEYEKAYNKFYKALESISSV
jgi:prephenate dehydrogenase